MLAPGLFNSWEGEHGDHEKRTPKASEGAAAGSATGGARKAEKIGEASVKRTGEKARKAADRAVAVE